MFRCVSQMESRLFNQIEAAFRWNMQTNTDRYHPIQRQITLRLSHALNRCIWHHAFFRQFFAGNLYPLHMGDKHSVETSGKIKQKSESFLRLLKCIFCAVLDGQCQSSSVICFVTVQLAVHIMRLLASLLGPHEVQTALIYICICPFRQSKLSAFPNNVQRLVDTDMTIRINIAACIDDSPILRIAEILFQRLLRANDKCRSGIVFAQIKGIKQNLLFLHKSQCAPGSGIPHMNHVVARLVVLYIEVLRQLSERRLMCRFSVCIPPSSTAIRFRSSFLDICRH